MPAPGPKPASGCGPAANWLTARSRSRRAGRVWLGGALAALLAIGFFVPPARGEPVLLAAGDMRGEIKPCGCSPEGQLGGLPRRLTYLQQAYSATPERPPILVDLGNNFPEPSEQGRLKIELIQHLLAVFSPDAILPGPSELANGVGVLAPELNYVASNDAIQERFRSHVTVRRDGERIGLYGYLSPSLVYQEFDARFRLLPVDAGLIARLRDQRARAGHDRAVLLFRGPDAELGEFVAAGLFDRILLGNPSADELEQIVSRRVEGRLSAQVPTKGQGFHRLPLGADHGDVLEPDWLSEEYADHPEAVASMARYDEQVKGLFFARLETLERHQHEAPFVGAASCAACHPAQDQVWRASRHATALATLERVGKQFDPECLACHVVGLDAGGFLSKELTPHLANVQCENCHGSARAHAADPAKAKLTPLRDAAGPGVGAQVVCRACHRGSHSPTFDFARYWPLIAH